MPWPAAWPRTAGTMASEPSDYLRVIADAPDLLRNNRDVAALLPAIGRPGAW